MFRVVRRWWIFLICHFSITNIFSETCPGWHLWIQTFSTINILQMILKQNMSRKVLKRFASSIWSERIAEGYIFYEAKFRKEPITESMVQNEIQQVQQTGLNCYRYGFFSRAGFACEEENDRILIGINELYLRVWRWKAQHRDLTCMPIWILIRSGMRWGLRWGKVCETERVDIFKVSPSTFLCQRRQRSRNVLFYLQVKWERNEKGGSLWEPEEKGVEYPLKSPWSLWF